MTPPSMSLQPLKSNKHFSDNFHITIHPFQLELHNDLKFDQPMKFKLLGDFFHLTKLGQAWPMI